MAASPSPSFGFTAFLYSTLFAPRWLSSALVSRTGVRDLSQLARLSARGAVEEPALTLLPLPLISLPSSALWSLLRTRTRLTTAPSTACARNNPAYPILASLTSPPPRTSPNRRLAHQGRRGLGQGVVRLEPHRRRGRRRCGRGGHGCRGRLRARQCVSFLLVQLCPLEALLTLLVVRAVRKSKLVTVYDQRVSMRWAGASLSPYASPRRAR